VPPITIRRAEARDLPTVFALVEELLTELGEEGQETGSLAVDQLSSLCEGLADTHLAFLAETPEGEAVGVLTVAESFALYAKGQYGIINELYVRPTFRSTAVGAQLIATAARHGQSLGWRRIDVTAPESERWARTRDFYARQGFVFAGPKLKRLL